jgi:hypothetical protein
MENKPKLNEDDFYHQFPNLDKHHDSSNYSRPRWWDMYDDVPASKKFKHGGGVHGYATGGNVEDREMVKLSDHFGNFRKDTDEGEEE